jgi:preprotein translocase subunit SecY
MVADLTKEFKDMLSGDLGIWSARLAYLTVMLICMFLFVFLAHGKREVSLFYPGKRIQISGKNFVLRGSMPLSVNLSSDGLLGGNLLLGYVFVIFPFLLCSNIGFLQSLALEIMSILGRNIDWFGPLLFILVFVSTFFYTENQFMASYFVPRLMASGATIPGINNRNEQHYYLRRIQRSITFANALGLSLFSIVPWAFMLLTHTSVSLLDAQRWIFIVSVVYEIDAYFLVHRKEKYPF